MVIQIVPFDRIISSSDWEETKGDAETLLVAKPPKGGLGVSLFQYSDDNHDSISGSENGPYLFLRIILESFTLMEKP